MIGKKTFRIGRSVVDYYLSGSMAQFKSLLSQNATVLITDENVYEHHAKYFKGWNTIVLKSGEEYKVQATIDSIVEQLIEMGADRTWTLVGVGGGVVTDITGYVASIYMRGLAFGFVPTTLLAMVDASIGGKNGIDVGIYKNMVGIIRQPSFILWDVSFLKTLPPKEWANGFAEIIKHACIKDGVMFSELESNSIGFYQKQKNAVEALIGRNVLIKTKVVKRDEGEKGDRKLLNFGHTLGHALENQYELSHGEAISIGMSFASSLSTKLLAFRGEERVKDILEKYGLPTAADFGKNKVFNALKRDKKKEADTMNFILLNKIGKAVIHPISIDSLKEFL